ncbi:MAG: 3-dehydroquinate dehydratase [Flavobacteriales bacterium]|nr:3-dehydroquinate dehydratase [Flavobacteriales bacterium]
MKIAIVNGPNLNLTGKREKDIYGDKSFDGFIAEMKKGFPQIEIDYFQSNIEGELIDHLHALDKDKTVKGILLNAGGYTHTSVAIGDAVAAIDRSVIEVHMSNIFAREDFRHVSFIGKHSIGSIAGFGMESYLLGILKLLNQA